MEDYHGRLWKIIRKRAHEAVRARAETAAAAFDKAVNSDKLTSSRNLPSAHPAPSPPPPLFPLRVASPSVLSPFRPTLPVSTSTLYNCIRRFQASKEGYWVVIVSLTEDHIQPLRTSTSEIIDTRL